MHGRSRIPVEVCTASGSTCIAQKVTVKEYIFASRIFASTAVINYLKVKVKVHFLPLTVGEFNAYFHCQIGVQYT